MKLITRTLLAPAGFFAVSASLLAAEVVLPLEIRQETNHYNLASPNGMPISYSLGSPPGSDGRAPGPNPGPIGTVKQFQGLMSFGGVVRPAKTNLTPTLSYAANAANLDLPRGGSGNAQTILLRGRVGNPMFGRRMSFLFGQVIPPPDTDEYGVQLAKANTNAIPNRLPSTNSVYWLPEPYATTDPTNSGYYWSPHAERVYATATGPITIVWRKAVSSQAPSGQVDVATVTNNGLPYIIYTNRYFVSTVPCKSPRRMYWTEGPFSQIGKYIHVPTDRVRDIHVVYHPNFPELLTNEFYPSGMSIAVTNTLWYDRTLKLIRAYNIEGRVFIELLGDKRGQFAGRDIHHQLGFEIVDLSQRPVAEDVTTELGELITPFQGKQPADTPELFPEPVLTTGDSFAYQHSIAGSSRFEYFAIRETKNQNDYQVHWMEKGLEGLLWPYRFVRYEEIWPADVAHYSHYIRPVVYTEQEAKATAVVLPSDNAPSIAYQDPLDQPRGKLTESFAYYSFLTANYPAHRALLVFVSGEHVRFERVFSWLDQHWRIDANQFKNSVATNLSAWISTNNAFDWPEESVRPRVKTVNVFVGDRLSAPAGEPGAGSSADYLAGFIRESEGTSYHPTSYINPFMSGFDLANQGAIIPVNAIPNHNVLEVWWFRTNNVNPAQGFKNSFWPAVITRYTIRWPTHASEIILASNDGSGPLGSLEAKGTIYYENDRSKPGFNPNEEHALMEGGQVWALRDDLNDTKAGATYTSDAFVLLQYAAADGRTAIRPFKVLREKGDIRFEFEKAAGSILQPPMPLPLLGPAFAPKVSGERRKGLNEEIVAWTVNISTQQVAKPLWTLTTTETNGFGPFWTLALQNTDRTETRWFFGTNVTSTTLHGFISTNRPARLKAVGTSVQQPANTRWRFGTDSPGLIPIGKALVALPASSKSWVVTVTEVTAQFVEVDFSIPRPAEVTNEPESAVLVPTVNGYIDGAFQGWSLAWNELPQKTGNALHTFYSSATYTDRKGNVWIYRGPHTDNQVETFTMRFYYNTLPGFFFPTLGLDAQPPVGTPTPYLRPVGADGQFVGDAVYGNADKGQEPDGNALPIRYHPVWPDNVPVLQMAETLTTPKRGLPAVRGQTSLQVLYQQSHIESAPIGSSGQQTLTIDPELTSVVLHDPTREKTFEFEQANLPGSVLTETSRGKIWFPKLPPHLVKRFFLDPNRGANGALVFAGEFVDAPMGDKYVLLNVAGEQDAATLQELCKPEDPKKNPWNIAVNGLFTDMERFVENPAKPGTYIVLPSATTRIGLSNVVEVTDDDVAVDSYALTAVGPKTGYVSLLAGDGEAFTAEGDPVSVHVLRVAPELYRGEVNVIQSDNPLNEKLTLQQVVDLAGRTENYQFEWRIAAPVDGQPLPVYTKEWLEFQLASWSHIRFPLVSDRIAGLEGTTPSRLVQDVSTTVAPVITIPFTSVEQVGDLFQFNNSATPAHLVKGNQLTMSSVDGKEVQVTVHDVPAGGTKVLVSVDSGQELTLKTNEIFGLSERVIAGQPQSILFTRFVIPPEKKLTEIWLGLEHAIGLGAKVYLNGALVASSGLGASDTTPDNPPSLVTPPLERYFKLPPSALSGAQVGANGSRTNHLAVELFSSALPGEPLTFQARVEAFHGVDEVVSKWKPLDAAQYEDGVRAIVGEKADVRSLSDNYLTMRYVLKAEAADTNRWSQWTEPQLAEGWIKRVLAGINPFNQRVTDLFNNAVNTEVSMLRQAGQRWEGDVALNLDSINNYGLIEIYETVLNRGKMLSIGSGINYGPANDALLLAAGYINDLYMMVGNEAAADAANPTIGIGTKDNTYGDIATALFCFKGQLPSLLEEELALLRGRDDFLVPGVGTRPVYNRLVWNYTRGIDAGEVIYALNYNILDQNTDGRVDADDARRLFPQGHGDAYGHYLTALMGYYHLLLDPNFDWVPRSEAVLVLGKPVSVDYQDERKFAAAAGALARAGKQVFDLTWRKDYKSGTGNGWSHFRDKRSNTSTGRTRYWGLDHWAVRTGQGAYLNWIAGNAMLPEVDPDPAHLDTIQQVDRTTVPELKELPSVAEALQIAMDNAESGMTPLGLPESSVSFDLNPNVVISADNQTHFDQIYSRAKAALNNALVAFDDAKDVTRLMRSEQDSLADFRTAVAKQELAYTNALIELYGTPYPEDIGPGKTYRTGFAGPDLMHFMYIDNVELSFVGPQGSLLDPAQDKTWRIDTQTFTANWTDADGISDFTFIQPARNGPVDGTEMLEEYTDTTLYVEYNLASHGFFKKPDFWLGRRSSPGKLQQAISDIAKARNAAYAGFYRADAVKYDLDWAIQSFAKNKASHAFVRDQKHALLRADSTLTATKAAWDITDKWLGFAKDKLHDSTQTIEASIPKSLIAGLSNGGDLTAPIRGTIRGVASAAETYIAVAQLTGFSVVRALEAAEAVAKQLVEFEIIGPEQWRQELRNATSDLRGKVYAMNDQFMTINQRLQELDDAHRKYRALLAEGDRIQQEREIYRQRASAVIQGYRTRDAAFRIFRNEKLERYKTLFDLAAQYAFLATKAYDYETGLLGTQRGQEFVNRVVNARALGVVQDGEPQFAGSNTGDPGLSSVLAEMHADWSVAKGRLGFNNPDAYGTTVSLRYENYRIITNNAVWKNVLNLARRANLLDDPDVRRYCLQLDAGDGLPVPGLVLDFSTTITDGLNLFGHALAPGDNSFSASSFATKIFAAGVALEGYVGMADPASNLGAVSGSGATSPPDPSLIFLDPNALSATPYIYLIPVGVDSMRSPPLGDTSDVRTWAVDDVAIPLPFNIGGSDFSNVRLWQSRDSLTEDPFAIRKHQAFRPVSSASFFSPSIYTSTGGLQRSQFTNNRLVGRSVWNSKWKLVIPGRALLSDPDEGLERFLRTVKDVKLHFVTYSYSGN